MGHVSRLMTQNWRQQREHNNPSFIKQNIVAPKLTTSINILKMASIQPIDKMEAGQQEDEAESEPAASLEQMEKKWNAAISNSKQEQEEQDSEGICGRKRCRVATMIVVITLVVAAIVIGIVVGSNGSDTDDSYDVDVQWQAQTYNGWNFGFVGPYGTSSTVKDRGEAWDDKKEFKVKLDVQEDGKAIVKAELHQSGKKAHHVCCSHELQAGVAVIDSGYYGEWGNVKSCKCSEIWYDHQIRAKVSTL